ncbi:hypothetical protein PINS_up020847 [Pythium insidiosum]|nr:hypothetical protein PINS_up020847 [Pythium insidiosum]
MPRLNRGFVRMYLDFSSQFTSSLREVVTAPMVLSVALYAAWMLLWAVVVFTTDASGFPSFALPLSHLIPTATEAAASFKLRPRKYPFWRKTLGFKGAKRFDFLPTADSKDAKNANKTRSSTPPNILLINVESFRSREVGVIGGRHLKAKYNQTVTPFLDELSRSGVVFREHYTRCYSDVSLSAVDVIRHSAIVDIRDDG